MTGNKNPEPPLPPLPIRNALHRIFHVFRIDGAQFLVDISSSSVSLAEFTERALYLNITSGRCDGRPRALLVGSVHPTNFIY